MPDWALALLSAVAASTLTILIREGIEWFNRPRLGINFEDVNKQKPYIHDLSTKSFGINTSYPRMRLLRLNVHNSGRKPALNCEAKMVIIKDGKEGPVSQIIHWSRRDIGVYRELGQIEQVYTPININRSDNESLDLLELFYSPEQDQLPSAAVICSVTPRYYVFHRNAVYHIEITVYADNVVSKVFTLILNWDGTLDGFKKAVSIVGA